MKSTPPKTIMIRIRKGMMMEPVAIYDDEDNSYSFLGNDSEATRVHMRWKTWSTLISNLFLHLSVCPNCPREVV